MVNKNLVGRCGLYCGACGIYRAYKDGGEYLASALAEFPETPREKVRCEGCQALTPQCWGNECKIIKCLNAKGLQSCYECTDYENHTCEKFEKFSEGALKRSDIDLRANLRRIKAGEVDNWLRKSEEKFSCAHCGKPLPFDVYTTKCYHCGKKLS